MAAEKQYVQCTLQLGTETTTGWIEQRGAKKGAKVELFKGSSKFWWVREVFDSVVLSESQLREHQQLHRNSLPSVEGMR